MARTAASPLAYVEAWKSQDYDAIHNALLKEASRQVNEMVKWMNCQIVHDPDEMKELHLEDGIFGLIKKARNYRQTMIYHRNRFIAEAEFDKIKAELEGDHTWLKEINDQINTWLDEQHGGCRRILKIYLYVKFKAGGTLEIPDPEDLEYEYAPEDS